MIKNGPIEQFSYYSQFQSVEEFNEHMRLWLDGYSRQFTKSELLGLKQLTQFAVKVVGVANLKIGTALKVMHESNHVNGISRSTWKRMTIKAKKIGLLQIYELKRESGGQSSNLYVFMRYPNEFNNKECTKYSQTKTEPPCQENLNHQKTTILKTKIIVNEKNRDEIKVDQNLDHTYTSDSVPRQFVQLVKVFYDNCEVIEEYWRMAKLAAYNYLYENYQPFVLEVAIAAFKQTIRKIKKATVKKPIAYFYTVTKQKFAEHFYEIQEPSDEEEEVFTYKRSGELSWLSN